MHGTVLTTAILMAAALAAVSTASAQEPPRILFLEKSEGFVHPPVAGNPGDVTIADKVLTELAQQNGATIECTKDASKINAANLKHFDVVIFYTQGDLTKAGKDDTPLMGPDGQAELLEWIKNGGRFAGFHSASDTFHPAAGAESTPYLKMVGAEFAGHGGQFEGAMKVVDPMHPAVASIPSSYKPHEEWYTFKNFNKESVHVLALMDPGDEGIKQDKYDIAPYPVIWCSAYGKGKVYFSALGHNGPMWQNDPVFRQSLLDAGTWLIAPGTEGTEPNFDKVVPKEKTKK